MKARELGSAGKGEEGKTAQERSGSEAQKIIKNITDL